MLGSPVMHHEVALQELQGNATDRENASQRSLLLMDKGKQKVYTRILTKAQGFWGKLQIKPHSVNERGGLWEQMVARLI